MVQLPHGSNESDVQAHVRQKGTRGQRRSHTKCFVAELISRLDCVETQFSALGRASAEVAKMQNHTQMLEGLLANMQYQFSFVAHSCSAPFVGEWLSFLHT